MTALEPPPPGNAAAPACLPAALCVLGLGQIGGSLARAATGLIPTFGWSPSETTRAAAAQSEITVLATAEDALTRAASTDALVVLAGPVPTFGPTLDLINQIHPRALLTDVGSMKGAVDLEVRERAPEASYVGSHPMTGSQHSGWAATDPALFRDAVWVSCLADDTDLESWVRVSALALAIGSKVIPADPERHDDAVARISHLPHLLALALAEVGANGGPLALSLAAGSFTDGTRVAGTRPELIRAMTEPNAEALIGAADELLGVLGVARGSLASSGSLRSLTERGHEAHRSFLNRSADQIDLTVEGDDVVEELLAVGSAGGHVYAIEGTPQAPVVRVRYPDPI